MKTTRFTPVHRRSLVPTTRNQKAHRPRIGMSGALPRSLALTLTLVAGPLGAQSWEPVTWQDESAYALVTTRWRAIVSVERGRLVHFGPADREVNLLFAPRTRNEPIGWGGHRVWLGPQLAWEKIWPPAPAWEASAAEAVKPSGSRLELAFPGAGDGWPRVTRIYEYADGRLACRVVAAADGTRDAQIVQIFQTPPAHDLIIPVEPTAEFPHGCVLLPPIGGRREAVPLRELPAHVEVTPEGLRLRQADRPEKIGFPPRELSAAVAATHRLRVGRGVERGTTTGAPDRGFYTQVYLGDALTPVIELEQLSPLFKAGEEAESSVWLDLDERP